MTTSQYKGSITLYSSNANFRGPKTVDGHFNLKFSDDLKTVTVTDFEPVVIEHIDVTVLKVKVGETTLTASMLGNGSGTFVQGSGALDINAEFKFELAIPLTSPSQLVLKLTTTQATMPAGNVEKGLAITPGSGVFRLVSAGKFKGGQLDKVKCGVILDGKLTPSPT